MSIKVPTLTITATTNGYYTVYDSGHPDDPPKAAVHEAPENEDESLSEAKALQNLMYYVLELFDQSSRYSKARVHISIIPGDKYAETN
jgi:hypothetical protein